MLAIKDPPLLPSGSLEGFAQGTIAPKPFSSCCDRTLTGTDQTVVNGGENNFRRSDGMSALKVVCGGSRRSRQITQFLLLQCVLSGSRTFAGCHTRFSQLQLLDGTLCTVDFYNQSGYVSRDRYKRRMNLVIRKTFFRRPSIPTRLVITDEWG